ncbi:MAG: glycine cleavage system protein GcvH [Rhodospirillales bacterium]|nr:glycine cleavage system protein GcvH [Rhodospirillales bacterium]MBO6785643.1 glycine cleavage system protein GcvH [Rhodospirillales bacterium]
MMAIKYTKDHEWIDVDGEIGTVGITNHAQEQLGELVYVEVPEVGATLEQGDEACVVESVKAASEVYSPCSGEIVEVNEDLADAPTTVNEHAEGDGWLFKIKLSDMTELDEFMDEADYKEFLKELDE